MTRFFETKVFRQMSLAGAQLTFRGALALANFMKFISGLRYGAVFTLILAAVGSSGAAYADPISCATGGAWGIKMRATAFNVVPGDSQSSTYDSTGNTSNCLTANSVSAPEKSSRSFCRSS